MLASEPALVIGYLVKSGLIQLSGFVKGLSIWRFALALHQKPEITAAVILNTRENSQNARKTVYLHCISTIWLQTPLLAERCRVYESGPLAKSELRSTVRPPTGRL